jgi:hypothetical protein
MSSHRTTADIWSPVPATARYEVAEINETTGQPTTHLVKTACANCSAFLVATPEYADRALCSACMSAEALEALGRPTGTNR